jgi:hypothetical protein
MSHHYLSSQSIVWNQQKRRTQTSSPEDCPIALSTPSMTGQFVRLSRYALSIAAVHWLDYRYIGGMLG